MSSPKITTALATFAKLETTYGTGVTTSAGDVVQVAGPDFPIVQIQYASDGNRNGGQMSNGNIQRTGVGGRTFSATYKIEGKGLGSAYSVSAFPPNLYPFLIASGMSGSFEASGHKLTGKPPSTTQVTSMGMNAYDRGELVALSGSYCSMKFSANGPAPTIFEFAVQGLAGLHSDTTVPSRTWSAVSIIPPKNEGTAFAISGSAGNFTGAKIRSYEFDSAQEIVPRVNINATSGHAGFTLGRRNPTFSIVMEAELLSNFDPYTYWNNGSALAISLTVGSVQYNRFSFAMNTCTISNVEKQSDGPTALWNVTFTPSISAPDASDDLVITFN